MDTRDRLPPGQAWIRRLAVTGEKEPAPFTLEEWRLEVDGCVARPLRLTLADVLARPAAERVWDTHCVTTWSREGTQWRGVLLSDLLEEAQPLAGAKFARLEACSLRRHDTSLPLEYARHHVLLAYECDGRPLEPAHGFPLRAVTEGKYFYKSLKWLNRIELLEADAPGYWERHSAYDNAADPWSGARYVPQPLPPEEFRQRVARRDFRGAMAIRDEQFALLRGADLAGANFEGAEIKSCELVDVNLQGARCRGANFTLSSFMRSNLQEADLSDCDLEGANFNNADLRGADLRRTALTMTRFHGARGARIAGALILRADIERAGMLDSDRAYLLDPASGAALL